MAQILYNQLEWYYNRIKTNPSRHTYKLFKDKCDELSDLIYKMWQNELISDKVSQECYKVISDMTFDVTEYYYDKCFE